jgi:serine/threonine protein kinase
MPQKQPDPSQPNFVNHRFGSYHLIEFLGQGGFAQVYKGVHVANQLLAAIKVFVTAQNNQPNTPGNEALERLKKEVGPLQRLNHPRIIRLLEIGIQSSISGFPQGIPYLVMEFAPHGTLYDACKGHLPLDLGVVVDYINEIAQGLQYLHDQEIIHRDLKPLNLLLDAQNHIVIADFGLATALERDSSFHLTRVVKGTPDYMAPEQWQGQTRKESDQYSLAVITYEWLTGVKPIQSNRGRPLPPAVEQVITRGLAPNAKDRFPSVTEFARALTLAAKGGAPASPSPTYDASTIRQNAQQPSNQWTWTPSPPSSAEWRQAGWGSTPSAPSTPSSTPFPGQQFPIQPAAIPYDPASPGEHVKHFPVSKPVKEMHWIGGRFLAATTADTLYFWDMVSPGNDATHPIKESNWKFSPDRRFIAGPVLDGIEVYDLAQQTRVHTYKGLKNATALAWSPDGQRIVAAGTVERVTAAGTRSSERAIHLWYMATGQLQHATQPHSGPLRDVTLLAWSPGGGYIASADQGGSVMLWNAGDLSYLRARQSGAQAFRTETLSDLLWSSDDQYLALLTQENQVHVWKANPLSQPNAPANAPGPWGENAQQDFRTYFISAQDRPLALWKPSPPWNAQAQKQDRSNLLALLTGPSTVEVIDTATGATINSHACAGSVLSVAWSPDGKALAAGCEEGTIEIWEPRTGISLSHPATRTGGLARAYQFAIGDQVFQVEALAWSPDGRLLASAGNDPASDEHMIWVWKAHQTTGNGNEEQNEIVKKLGVNLWLALALGAFDLIFPALTGIVTNSLFAFFLIPPISLVALIWAAFTLNEWRQARKQEEKATFKGVPTVSAISWGLTCLIIGITIAQGVVGVLIGLVLAAAGGTVGWHFHRFLLKELHQSLFPSRFGSGFHQF